LSVLVDTPVWSVALRRKPSDRGAADQRRVDALAALVRDGRAVLIGPIRQELLSGIREPAAYERLRQALRAFPDEPLAIEDFEEAARAGNTCRSAGVAGSLVDFLICAASIRRGLEVFTIDNDFNHYARHLPLRLYVPSPPAGG
jgi:predicted nucleic acid-binding protein